MSVDRQLTPQWNDFAIVDDVVMIAYDPSVTVIDLTTPGTKVARGTTSTDAAGSRTPTLLISAGTQATMTLPDGSTQVLSRLSLRATEFTVGPTGPKAMPAVLPPQSAYTYCVELSADEGVAAGATSINFSKPAVFYLDNYINFDVGGAVPVGYYDRSTGVWVPSDNGLVVQILAVVLGEAYLDVNGTGVAADPATLAQLGIDDAERQLLANLYPVGKTLWRVPIPHLTPWDCNWPYDLPADAIGPNGGQPWWIPAPDCTTKKPGSIIECESEALGEAIPVTGNCWNINYNSVQALVA